ncbi:hypothetical protein Tco_1377446 [Tanacetum coccineum]
MIEPEVPLKRKDQVALDEQLARDVQAQLEAELIEKEKLARKQEEEANIALIEAEEKRRKPPTKAQKRNQMSTYLKNIGRYKHNQLKSKSFKEIQKMFANEMRRVNTFIPIDSEVVKKVVRRKLRSSRKKSLKEKSRERTNNRIYQRNQSTILEDDKDPDRTIDVIPLATRLPVIVDYKLHKEGLMAHFELIRADGTSKRYTSMIRLLQGIDREDLQTLWKLVKTKHGDIRPEGWSIGSNNGKIWQGYCLNQT